MFKTQRHSNEQQNEQTQATDHTQAGPSLDSNAQSREEAGLIGGGADVSEMGLGGSFAGMVLDCMPLIAAVPLARKFKDNVAVQEWASQYSLLDVADSLGSAANHLLKDFWPVGLGFDVEGQVAGAVIVGGDMTGTISALRTETNSLEVSVDGKAGVGIKGCGAGVALTNAFGEEVASAMAKAQVGVESRYIAENTMDFDLVSVLKAYGGLCGQSLVDTLGATTFNPVSSLMLDAVDAQIPKDAAWDMTHELSVSGSAGLNVSSISDDYQTGMISDCTGLGELADYAQQILPLIDLAAEASLTFRQQSDGTTTVEREGSLSVLSDLFSKTPYLAELVSPEVVSALAEGTGGGVAGRMSLVMHREPGTVDIDFDAEKSGIALIGNAESGGQSVETEAFFSFNSLADSADGMLEGGMAGAVLLGDITKTARIELDPQVAEQHCPQLVQQILGLTGELLDAETQLALEGTMTLKANAMIGLFGTQVMESIANPDHCMQYAMDLAGGLRREMPSELSQHADLVQQLAASVEFSEARIVGHMHQGVGGGVSAKWGAGVKAVGRVEGGAVIDKVVEGPDADRIRRALVGGRSAA